MSESPLMVAWGELLWDLFPDGHRLGGAAANVAYHLAQLGNRAYLVSRVGNDEPGARARAELSAARVITDFIQVDDDHETGSVRVEVVDGEPHYRIANEVAWDSITWQPELRPLLNQARVFCYSTLAQRSPLGFAVIEEALRYTRSDCVRLCDLNIRPPFTESALVSDALALASVIKLNDSELDRVRQAFGVPDPMRWFVEERGIELAVLTMGAGGSRFVTRDGQFRQPAIIIDQPGGDSVGAGDAFVAVLAHGLARGIDLPVLAEQASRYAGFVAAQSGAMPRIPAELRALF